jgi:hypothetical protein
VVERMGDDWFLNRKHASVMLCKRVCWHKGDASAVIMNWICEGIELREGRTAQKSGSRGGMNYGDKGIRPPAFL